MLNERLFSHRALKFDDQRKLCVCIKNGILYLERAAANTLKATKIIKDDVTHHHFAQ